MLQDINIEEVKRYNASLKQYKDQSATLAAEIQFNEKELNSLCEQLSTELGVQVTPTNIEQIYEEQVSKINTALQTGNTILQKIAQESANPVANSAVASTIASQAINVPGTPVMETPVTPVAHSQVPPSAPVFASAPSSIPDALPPLNAGQPMFKLS